MPILPHNNFDLRMPVEKALVFLYTSTFFRNFEHLKELKELNGVDKLGTELEIAQN